MHHATIDPDKQVERAYSHGMVPYPSIPDQTITEITCRRPRWQRWLGRLIAILERVALVDADINSRDYFEPWPLESRGRKQRQKR